LRFIHHSIQAPQPRLHRLLLGRRRVQEHLDVADEHGHQRISPPVMVRILNMISTHSVVLSRFPNVLQTQIHHVEKRNSS
jgi:hypothetical protein